MEIKGKVTIDLKTFEELINKAKTLEALEKHKMSVEDTALEMIKRDREEMQVEILGIISDIDESDAQPIFEEIDGTVMTDKEVDMKYQEAISKFKIVISPQKLKRLIQKKYLCKLSRIRFTACGYQRRRRRNLEQNGSCDRRKGEVRRWQQDGVR